MSIDESLVESDLNSLVDAHIKNYLPAQISMESYNNFVRTGIKFIIEELFKISKPMVNQNNKGENKDVNLPISFLFEMQVKDTTIEMPMIPSTTAGQNIILTPAMARVRGESYSGNIMASVHATLKTIYSNRETEIKVVIPKKKIGTFPVMVGSILCHTYGKPTDWLENSGEDPTDCGGYFIIHNREYVVENGENLRYNSIHLNATIKDEYIRGEYISQPNNAFENSSHLKVAYFKNGKLHIEFNSQKFVALTIPYWVMFRMLGVSNDLEMAKYIVYNTEGKDPTTKALLDILYKAYIEDNMCEEMKRVTDQSEIIYMVVQRAIESDLHNTSISNMSKAEAIHEMLNVIDGYFLPRLGKSSEDRIAKIRFLGYFIREVLITKLGLREPTDRDHLANKRIHDPAITLSKCLKTHLNLTFYSKITKKVRSLVSEDISKIEERRLVDIINSIIEMQTLGEKMDSSILNIQQKDANGKVLNSRMNSAVLERKNPTNVISALRNISIAKGTADYTERAKQQRQVHSSYHGFIDALQSADTGKPVGTKKQITMTTRITSIIQTNELIALLSIDTDIVKIDDTYNMKLYSEGMYYVMFNGAPIGLCYNPTQIMNKYKQYRLEGRIFREIMVYVDYDVGVVHFMHEIGCLIRPMIKVYNNAAEYEQNPDTVQFKQYIKFTKEMMDWDEHRLIDEGICEYVTVETCVNSLIAYGFNHFKDNMHNPLLQYTHVDVQITTLGYITAVGNYLSHTQAARGCYHTVQFRQGISYAMYNYNDAFLKNRAIGISTQYPLVYALGNKFTSPNGENILICVKNHEGKNLEDSIVVSKAASERGRFCVVYIKVEDVTIERGQKLMIPDSTITRDIKSNGDYSRLDDRGIIKVGTIVTDNMVLVGRVELLKADPTKSTQQIYKDKSILYNSSEPALVQDVKIVKGSEDLVTVYIRFHHYRPVKVGDKLSSRSGNKGIVSAMECQSDLPYSQDGEIPDIIVNCHSFPSRMMFGQLIEMTNATIAAEKGIQINGTTYMDIDYEKQIDELMSLGLRANNTKRMYNGKTGQMLQNATSFEMCTYQRLQKFVIDDEQAVGLTSPVDETTGQPLGGKHQSGGLRIGEMERWTLDGSGCSYITRDKRFTNSNGRVAYICRRCGNYATVNVDKKIYSCFECKEKVDIQKINTTKTTILFHNELNAAHIKLTLNPEPRAFYE
jgi:DNA-directed RNA polymerase beta subunit